MSGEITDLHFAFGLTRGSLSSFLSYCPFFNNAHRFVGGKSTICRLALRLYDVDSGKVLVNGVDVRKVTQQSLRRNIGVVQQEPSLFNDSLRENIKFGCLDPEGVSDAEVLAAAKTAALGDFVARLSDGLDTVVGMVFFNFPW